ncbi:TonB-dependent siderophore receptor [Caballeronia ptereochthonis]|uniref:TonB-dependent siderophore receptor n=2 Tax=Caballeronia ptereochthonis TaxID=1777144 RepID=A0A158E4F5_9BURK|nr:TonB-dependent siderophore receptor [Caballeronia ptereochthonis]
MAALLFATSQAGFAQGTQNGDGTQNASPPTEASLPAISVTASPDTLPHLREDVSSGALGSRTQLETPYSTTVVTGEELADRQANKLGDVFAQDASVSDNSNPYNAWASYVTVRGMQLDWQNGFRIDGQPFNGYGITMPYEQLESVELLKGLSGFMYGFGAPGGVVNYVTKKPPVTDRHIASVDVGYRSTNVWSEHVDLGGRVGPDSMFGYRFNATHEEGKTYNDGNVRRDSFSLAADARLTRDLTATFGALYQERHASGITTALSTAQYAGTSLPATLAGGSSTLVTPDQHLNTNLQIYTAGLRYNLNPDWTVSATYSFSKSTRYRNEGTWYLLDEAGNYDDYRFEGKEGHQLNTFQVMAEGLVKTGLLKHQLVFGAAYQKQTSDNGANSFFGQIGTGNIYQPNVNRYDSQGFYTYRSADVTQKALFASDTIALTQRWSVLGGVRYTNYEQHGYGIDGSTSSTYTQNGVLTPTVALMFKLTPGTTLYASYVESLEAGNVVGDTYANAGQLLKPLRSKQYEVGVKSQNSRWSATAALFRIERGAQYANGDNAFVEDGESIFQGIEAGADVRLGNNWTVGGDLMWIATHYEKGSSNDGNRVAGAPGFVAAAHVNYAVPVVPGLTLGADAKFTGNTSLDPSGGIKVPGYLIMNLGATYTTRIAGHNVGLRAAIDNLTNRRYWEFQYADYVQPGLPRTLSLNARVEF